MAKRHIGEELQREHSLTSPAQTRLYLQIRMRDYPHEVFACLMLDSQAY